MKKRAMWIFDKNYLLLTYLSVSSFVDHCDVITTLVYCGAALNEDDKAPFLALDTTIEFYHFEADVSQYEPYLQANILNRFARLHYTRLFEDDLLFMIDSDVAFSSHLEQGIAELESYFEHNSPSISGVVEFLSAKDAYLYFKKKDAHGYNHKISEDIKADLYKSVFGEHWNQLLSAPQYNNGFLVFYKARAVVDQWETYYLESLNHPSINPLDDQVPLAVAIRNTNCDTWDMPPKWNSLGDLDGDFIMFHAWGGEWKIEIDQVLRNGESTSTYGEICKKYLAKCPQYWLDVFFEDLKSFPYRYRLINGAFDHGTVFTDLIDRLDSGHVVEVGTYKGRSACFLAELIKERKKEIKLDTIDHYQRADTTKKLVTSNLEKADVIDYVNVIASESIDASQSYFDEQLDFVFLDTDSPADQLTIELDSWYRKIKAGGILAGYDYTIHDTVFKSYECVVEDFCKKNKLPLRTYEYQFIICKPNHPK